MPIVGIPIPSSSVSGIYASQSDLEDQFGENTVQQWSQMDATLQTPDENRILAALTFADSEIVAFFSTYGNYATPLQPLAEGVVIVRRWAALIAGAWLYQSRGFRQNDQTGSLVSTLVYGDPKDKTISVYDDMRNYAARDKLNATRRWPTSTAPVAVGCGGLAIVGGLGGMISVR